MFVQTAEALASAIDAKDPYTNGHSVRVAEYSRKIAENAGKTADECENISCASWFFLSSEAAAILSLYAFLASFRRP